MREAQAKPQRERNTEKKIGQSLDGYYNLRINRSASMVKIAAAQVASVCGDLDGNLRTHIAAIEAAAEHGVSVLVFPELSLSGYEPTLAAAAALTATDKCLTPLAALARQHKLAVIVGAPLQNAQAKPYLGAILFDGVGSVRSYAKMHLGGSESAYFAAGDTPLLFSKGGQTIGLAICADTSKLSHPQAYADGGATIYAAGVFLNTEWYATDAPRLSEYALRHRLLVVMANHAASVGTYSSVGRSAIWSPAGALVAEAAGTESCLVIASHSRDRWCGEVAAI
jgi:predicted amidohydrolase